MLLKPIKKFKVAEQNMYFISSFKYISATHCSTLEVKDYDRAVKKMQDLAVTYGHRLRITRDVTHFTDIHFRVL